MDDVERIHTQTINVRPDSGVYATYQRLSYRPWYAIAEFVDNSTQNYYENRENLKKAYETEGTGRKLKIEINYDVIKNVLKIYDNANGMEIEELRRAVTLNRPPPNTSGRCEFGMGLKTAACWFGRKWSINTTKLGSGRELQVTVHVPDLAINKTEEIQVFERRVDEATHFTKINIEQLYRPLKGRTLGRIKNQLGSLYRVDLRSKEIEILWDGEPVTFQDPKFLRESQGKGQETVWKREISFSVPNSISGSTLNAGGWVGIMIPGSQRDAGFALLRRGRVILGGPGEGYKPVDVFGQGNTFRSQRLVGELNLDEWPVTQAKDAFDWSGDLEEAFINELKKVCQDYMDKAEGHRERTKPVSRGEMEHSSEPIKEMFSEKKFEEAIKEEIEIPTPQKTPDQIEMDTKILGETSEGPIVFTLNFGTTSWIFRLHWQNRISDAPWMTVDYPQDNEVNIYLNMTNSFLSEFHENGASLQVLQKFVIAFALAEKLAWSVAPDGLVSPGEVRTKMNSVLRKASELVRNDES